MKNINSYRVFDRNKKAVSDTGKYVLYWMQSARRFEYHYGLEYAVAWANRLELPLLIYEGLNADYPWNSRRTSQFILEGMKEHHDVAKTNGYTYCSFVEQCTGEGKGILYKLANSAALVVSDEYPVFINRVLNERVEAKLRCKYITVDSNGLIPLGITEKAPYSAYIFRKVMQKHFSDSISHLPEKQPLLKLKHKAVWSELISDTSLLTQFRLSEKRISELYSFAASMAYTHKVEPLEIKGTREAALHVFDHFINKRLGRYHTHRNHPDTPSASTLSPWLHFGKITVFEIIERIISDHPNWSVDQLTLNNGKNSGFFNLSEAAESFFDEVITWREVGFHFAHHVPNYDQFNSLPDWALKTMDDHLKDPRPYIYTFEQLAAAKTHDPIWNAAQRQLIDEGIIHNYLRMLWGKKVIEWSSDYETALNTLIELNNIYAIDGRDPNSYSGIFWCFGRFDRAWTERPIFGKLRYMASSNTEKKIKMKGYLKRWGKNTSLFE